MVKDSTLPISLLHPILNGDIEDNLPTQPPANVVSRQSIAGGKAH